MGAAFEDEPLVDVAHLRVRAGDQKRGLAERLPFDAHLVRVLLHVQVLSPMDPVVRHVFVDELTALVDASLVQTVSALTQSERRFRLALPPSPGCGPVRIVRPFLGFRSESPQARQPRALVVPVGVAEHAARTGNGVELFRIAGEYDFRAT